MKASTISNVPEIYVGQLVAHQDDYITVYRVTKLSNDIAECVPEYEQNIATREFPISELYSVDA